MNVVFLSYCGPIDRYLIQQIQRKYPLSAIIRPVWTAAPAMEPRWRRFVKSPVRTLGNRASRQWAELRRRRLDAALFQQLAVDAADGSLPVPCVDVPAREINQPHAADLLRSFDPDVLIVSSAPLLNRRMFEIPRLATINVHRGIAPTYRGEHTLFWPLYLRDYQQIGVTIHKIAPGADTGDILAQGYPSLGPSDTLTSIMAKSTRLSADLLLQVLQRAEQGPVVGQPQHGPGRLFYSQDRRPRHDILYWARRNLLGERLPHQPQRSVLHVQAAKPADAACV